MGRVNDLLGGGLLRQDLHQVRLSVEVEMPFRLIDHQDRLDSSMSAPYQCHEGNELPEPLAPFVDLHELARTRPNMDSKDGVGVGELDLNRRFLIPGLELPSKLLVGGVGQCLCPARQSAIDSGVELRKIKPCQSREVGQRKRGVSRHGGKVVFGLKDSRLVIEWNELRRTLEKPPPCFPVRVHRRFVFYKCVKLAGKTIMNLGTVQRVS